MREAGIRTRCSTIPSSASKSKWCTRVEIGRRRLRRPMTTPSADKSTCFTTQAEIGASGTNAPRKIGDISFGGEPFIMKVPNNKVGLIIGKCGETIKSMQAKSGARIQLIPLHPPPGDTSTERTMQIERTNEQIELAKQLVNEVTSEVCTINKEEGLASHDNLTTKQALYKIQASKRKESSSDREGVEEKFIPLNTFFNNSLPLSLKVHHF